jgi:hypothetical protein
LTVSLEIVTSPSEWMRTHARLATASVRASHGYVQAATRLFNGAAAEAALVTHGNDLLLHPYIKRPVPFIDGSFDLISPYDFGGFWFSTAGPEIRQALVNAFEDEFIRYAAQAHIVCEFARLRPAHDMATLGFRRWELRKHQDNVVVPLEKGLEEVRAGYNANRRRRVMQGYRNGLTLHLSGDVTEFIDLYHASMDRLGADAEYYLPLSFLEQIAAFLLVAYVRSPDGALCAGHVFLLDGDGIYLYLAASVEEKLALRPNDFGYDSIIKYGVEHGFRYLHLGGGAESLYRYKRSFSSCSVPYHHLRCIFDQPGYDALVRHHDAAFPDVGESNFFPRYREALRSRAPTEGRKSCA